MNKQNLWLLCRIMMGILVVLTFTPLIIPAKVYQPMLLDLPYTLWTGIILAILMVVLTYIGTRVHPGRND